MTAIEEWGVHLAVSGLVLALLLMTAIAQRYQAYQATVGAMVAQIAQRADRLEKALGMLTTVPLSRELRLTLRSEIAACWRRVGKLRRRYPDIAAIIERADAALQQEGPTSSAGVGPLAGQRAFLDTVAAIDELIDLLRRAATLKPVPADVRRIFVRELGERRAEVHARYHMGQSHRCRSQGDLSTARSHLTRLMHVLRERGPSTEFVRELNRETEKALMSSITISDPAGSGDRESVA